MCEGEFQSVHDGEHALNRDRFLALVLCLISAALVLGFLYFAAMVIVAGRLD